MNSLGHYAEFVYDKASRVTETKSYEEAGATDVLKAHHKTTYDNMSRPWKEEDLLQGSPDTWPARTVVYDKRGLVVKMTDRRSNDHEFAYDGAGRRISAEDPLGNRTEWDYDANGNVTTLTETEVIPGGGTEAFETTFEYDAINRMKKRTVIDRTNGSNTKVTEWKRDALGVVRKEIDPKTWETTRDRDWLGRVTAERRDMGSSAEIVTSYEVNLSDQVTKLTDDNGSDTVYAYDAVGRLTTKTYENTKTVSYAYDKNNNVTQITDQNGSIFDQTFDDLDRIAERDGPNFLIFRRRERQRHDAHGDRGEGRSRVLTSCRRVSAEDPLGNLTERDSLSGRARTRSTRRWTAADRLFLPQE